MKANLLIVAGIALGLSACASTVSMQSPRADAKASATVTRGLFEPYLVEVSIDGKIYRGEWRTSDPTKEQKAATSYPHLKHVGQVRTRVTADDGSTLDCRFQTHGDTAEGTCSGSGHDYGLFEK